jgi:hypothetical protein
VTRSSRSASLKHAFVIPATSTTKATGRNAWRVAVTGVLILAAGVVFSHCLEPSVRLEKKLLSDDTPAIRLYPATPDPHPVALLAHGVTANKETLVRIAEALAAAGFDCYTVDQPGHGESRKRCSLDAILQSLEQNVQSLRSVDVFVGHSMGAGVGAWNVEERGFHPKLFIAVGADVQFDQVTNSPPLLLLAGRFDELVRLSSLENRTNAQVVISPWSDHALEVYDPILVTAAVNAACAVIGRNPPPAPTVWRWRLAGLLLGMLGAVALAFSLPRLSPSLTRVRGALVAAILIAGFAFTTGTWIGAAPQLPRIPLQLALMILIALALRGIGRFKVPRWGFAIFGVIFTLGCFVGRIFFPAFPASLLMILGTVLTLLFLVGMGLAQLVDWQGSRRDGNLAMAIFLGYAIGQYLPKFF